MTAYEMGISGWSSDVCSYDLGLSYERPGYLRGRVRGAFAPLAHRADLAGRCAAHRGDCQRHAGCRCGAGPATLDSRCRALDRRPFAGGVGSTRSEEHTSELQSLMRISYAVFCLKKKKNNKI